MCIVSFNNAFIDVHCLVISGWSLIDRRGIVTSADENQLFLPSALYSQHPQVTEDDATNTQDELLNIMNSTSVDGKVILAYLI